MGIAQRKERQRQELREQILTAARHIVADEGVEGLTMRKIADAVEYSPATLYLYFENREAIARQLCVEAFEHLLVAMAPAAAVADPLERLTAIGDAYVRWGVANAQHYRLVFMTDAKLMSAIFPEHAAKTDDDPGKRAFDVLIEAVDACRDCGAIAQADPLAVAEMLWTSLHGIVSLYLTCPAMLETPLARLRRLQLETLMHGLKRGLP